MGARAAVAMRNAKTAEARFQAAEKAYTAGDVHLASLLFQRTALSKRVPPHVQERAEQVLAEYRQQAAADLEEMIERIRYAGQSDDDDDSIANKLQAALEDVAVLVAKYENVPIANKALARQEKQLIRKNKLIGKYLHQPIAAELVRDAQRFEAEGHECCAYICYREAEKLMTCEAAEFARKRVYELRKQPGLLQSVADCEQIRECHVLFDKAQRISRVGAKDTYTAQAVKLYKQILNKAPRESEVHKAALEELNKLSQKQTRPAVNS
jgi:hypothetical protein